MIAHDGPEERMEGDASQGEFSTREAAAPGPTVNTLEADIAQTRAEMSDTIDAIQERLSPQRLTAQVKEEVRSATIGRAEHMIHDVSDSAQEAGTSIFATLRENPIPTALAAVGIGWLWMHRRSAGDHPRRSGQRERDADRWYHQTGHLGYPEPGWEDRSGGVRAYDDQRPGQGATGPRQAVDTAGQAIQGAANHASGVAQQAAGAVQQAVGQAGGTVQQVTSQASDAVQGAVGHAQRSAQRVNLRAQYQTRRARSGIQDAFEANPLGLGAIALAVGVAVGLAAPTTEVEHQAMGEARDALLQRAQSVAQDTMEKVQHVASQTAKTAQGEAQKQGLTG